MKWMSNTLLTCKLNVFWGLLVISSQPHSPQFSSLLIMLIQRALPTIFLCTNFHLGICLPSGPKLWAWDPPRVLKYISVLPWTCSMTLDNLFFISDYLSPHLQDGSDYINIKTLCKQIWQWKWNFLEKYLVKTTCSQKSWRKFQKPWMFSENWASIYLSNHQEGLRLSRCSVLTYKDIISHFFRVLLGLVGEGMAGQRIKNPGGWKSNVSFIAFIVRWFLCIGVCTSIYIY